MLEIRNTSITAAEVLEQAEKLRACTENGADPDVLHGAANFLEQIAAELVAFREVRADARRYCAFFAAGLPITYLGIDYRDKESLDAAIDNTPGMAED